MDADSGSNLKHPVKGENRKLLSHSGENAGCLSEAGFFFSKHVGLLVSSKPRTIRQWKALYRRRSSLETGRLDASLTNTALIPGVSLSSRHSQFQAWACVCLRVWLQVLVCLRVSVTCSNFYFSLSSETLIMFPLCKAVPVFPFSVHSLRGMTTCKCVCVCAVILTGPKCE